MGKFYQNDVIDLNQQFASEIITKCNGFSNNNGVNHVNKYRYKGHGVVWSSKCAFD